MIHPDVAIFTVRGRLNNSVRSIRFENNSIYRFHRELVKRGEFRTANEILETMNDQRRSQDMMIPKRLMWLAEWCGVLVTNYYFNVIAWGKTAATYGCGVRDHLDYGCQ